MDFLMNIDGILETLHRHEVAGILIGGVNFLLRHQPVLTYDVDVWIEDTPENLRRCEEALAELDAAWGRTEKDWAPVASKSAGWLSRQGVFCLTTPHGAIDIFRSVEGLAPWAECRARAVADKTSAGTPYVGLSDQDMLACQLALPETQRKQDRIRVLQDALQREKTDEQ